MESLRLFGYSVRPLGHDRVVVGFEVRDLYGEEWGMSITRRRFAGVILPSLAVASDNLFATRKETHGLSFGLHTFSFHEIMEGGMSAVDEILADTRRLGVNFVELYAPQLSPFPMPEGFYKKWREAAHPTEVLRSDGLQKIRREKLLLWRVNLPPSYFQAVRSKFSAAGVDIFALNYSFDISMSDAELDSGFEQAKMLGTKIITSSSTLSMAERLVPFATRHRMIVAFHNTTSSDPDRVVSPDAYAKLLAMSRWYTVNFDVAHYFAAGYDPVSFIEQHYKSIVSLHVHDRKRNNGPSVPNGEGDAPLREILQVLHNRSFSIPLFYELEWVGSGEPVPEIAKDLQYLQGLIHT